MAEARLRLKSGAVLRVETDVADPMAAPTPTPTPMPEGTRAIAKGGAGSAALKGFDAVADEVKALGEQLYESLSAMARQPDETKVEFGLKIGGEADLWLVKGDAEGHIKLTLSWKKA